MRSFNLSEFALLLLVMLLLSGCALLNRDTRDQLEAWGIDIPDATDWPTLYEQAPDVPEPPPVPDARPPADWRAIPESGEWVPDPRVILYEFRFQDGTRLRFREHHEGDYWGAYPAAGWGQIVWPDGREQGIDANKMIRKAGLPRVMMPVTTPDHGARLYWMARDDNSKRVPIFEDGWNPLVEGAVLATKESLGIVSPLRSVIVKVEK